jgi:hypothetical protein
MTITIAEAYMLHRLAPRPLSARVLHRWTFAAGGVLMATATAFAWWTAIDVRLPKPTIDIAALSVEIPTATSNEATEPGPQAPTWGGNGIVLQPLAERAAPFVPLQTRARAEMRRVQNRNVERGPALGSDFAPPEKSFTGAGGAFDAVH